MTLKMIAFVAAGGAIGAVMRFGVVSLLAGVLGAFPLGTMVVNIIGSFILGAIVESTALWWSPSAEIRAMVVVGCLGAFTTFSTFSLDVVTLISRGQMAQGMIYLGLSVALSIIALYMGMMSMKFFAS